MGDVAIIEFIRRRVNGVQEGNVAERSTAALFHRSAFAVCLTRQKGKGNVCIRANVAHQTGAYPGFCSMKRLGVFLLPPGWDASPSQS